MGRKEKEYCAEAYTQEANDSIHAYLHNMEVQAVAEVDARYHVQLMYGLGADQW